MEALKSPPKSFQKQPPSNRTTGNPYAHSNEHGFAETYRSSYSHGLEAIYKLENVDLKTVRPIEVRSTTFSEKPKQTLIKQAIPQQSELDFGPSFRNWIEPFVLIEPIQVLGLSKHAEKTLIDNQKTLLKHLIEADLQSFIFYKGLGQGHVDEIRLRLTEYIAYKPLKQTKTLDLASWIKSIVAAQERKKIYVLLEKYRLNEIISLSPLETVEVKRLTLEKKQEWIQEATQYLAQPQIQQKVLEQLQNVVDTLIKPWIRLRGNLATSLEIQERFQRICEQPLLVDDTILFFSEVFFNKQNLFSKTLVRLESHLYGSDLWVLNSYYTMIEKAKSYFYHEEVSYLFKELKCYLEKDFAKHWMSFEKIFFEKVLKLSSFFELQINDKKDLEILLK